MTFRYPADDLDNRELLQALLGTFWSEVFDQADLVGDLVFCRAQLERQAHADLVEAGQCLSRQNVPLYHVKRWYPITLKESERNASKALILRYGAGKQYGAGYLYGQVVVDDPERSVFPIPEALARVSVATERIENPACTFIYALDFIIDTARHTISFAENPFDNDNIPKTNVFTGGEVTDREITLWAFRAELDHDYLWTHSAYPLGLALPTRSNARGYVAALWSAIANGCSKQDLIRALAELTDVPCVRAATEVVEVIDARDDYLLIVTDQNVYRFNANATATVTVGDTVHAGDQLTDTVCWYDLGKGEVPSTLQAVLLDRSFLGASYKDGVIFVNQEQPVTVGSDGIWTTIQFPLSGNPSDVTRFWTDLHARGVEVGETLAHLLDTRTNKTGEPTASNLPATINPCEFLVANVLRNNAVIVSVDYNTCGVNKLDFVHLQWLRKLLPPHVALLFSITLDLGTDTIDSSVQGSRGTIRYSTAPGTSEYSIEANATVTSKQYTTTAGHC